MFIYHKDTDSYTCPAGETLAKHYKIKACLTCTLFKKCTRNKNGRLIERSEHADLIDANKKRLEQNQELYRKRQAIVEHPFGTIKRQWEYSYIMTKKTINHAITDVGLIFTAYNLRRLFTLIDQNEMKTCLAGMCTKLTACLSSIIAFFCTYPSKATKTTHDVFLYRIVKIHNFLSLQGYSKN